MKPYHMFSYLEIEYELSKHINVTQKRAILYDCFESQTIYSTIYTFLSEILYYICIFMLSKPKTSRQINT